MPQDWKHMCEVALLLGERGPDGTPLSQAEVAKRLGISQPKVSRLRQQLFKEQLVQLHVVYAPRLTGRPEWHEAQRRLLRVHQLRQRIVACSKRSIQLVLTGPVQDRDEFRRAAVPLVADLLRQSTRIGVASGANVGAVVRALPPLYDDFKIREDEVLVVPIIGEATHLQHSNKAVYGASATAEVLRNVLLRDPRRADAGDAWSEGSGKPRAARDRRRHRRDMPALIGVSAYIARCRSSETRRFFEELPGFRQIFGGPTPLIGTLDTILSGVGVIPHNPEKDQSRVGTLILERLAQEQSAGVTPDDLRKVIDGDIAGLLLPKQGVQSSLVDDLNAGLLGLKVEHLRAVCEGARNAWSAADQLGTGRRPPGVVVLACEDEKIPALRNAIHNNLLSTLVTTASLAEQLAEEFERANAKPKKTK